MTGRNGNDKLLKPDGTEYDLDNDGDLKELDKIMFNDLAGEAK